MYVFARDTVSYAVNGQPVTVKRGEIRHRLDPAVQARPEFFTDDPPVVARFPGWVPPELAVEQATAAPGERRASRRGI